MTTSPFLRHQTAIDRAVTRHKRKFASHNILVFFCCDEKVEREPSLQSVPPSDSSQQPQANSQSQAITVTRGPLGIFLVYVDKNVAPEGYIPELKYGNNHCLFV